MRFAWRVMAHVKSNTVIFTDAFRTLAIGAGQMSRVDAVKVATMKAGESVSLKGSVAASDAFFPFRDGLDAVAAAGATAVVQPGGSVKDAEVIAAADEHGLAMVFTGRRHFRFVDQPGISLHPRRACWCNNAINVIEGHLPWPTDFVKGRHKARNRPRPNGRRCALPGA